MSIVSIKRFLEAHKKTVVDFHNTWRIFRIMAEFVEGYQFLSGFKKEVTIFGSARFSPQNKWYKEAYKLGLLLGKNGYTTITGGGPGIMEAANKGAVKGGGESLGLNIQLPREQILNPYVKKSVGFHYFFTRKVMLTSPSQAFVFFPGGFGTLDELFDVLDAIENNKMQKVPVILLGKNFWQPLIQYLEEFSSNKLGAISKENLRIWTLVDTAEEAFEIIKKTKERVFIGDFVTKSDKQNKAQWLIFKIMAELVNGFEFLTTFKNDITVLGTKSIFSHDFLYQQAYALGKKLGEAGFTLITGGGRGIAEAVNKGAREVGAESLGISLQVDGMGFNQYVTRGISFSFPFIRKFILTAPSLAFIAFPGGYGTLSETFKVLELIQTRKMTPVPLILFGRYYWNPLIHFLRDKLWKENKTIVKEDLKIFTVVDKVEEIKL
jgi:uncharacterized protein (TIGR00730 family)